MTRRILLAVASLLTLGLVACGSDAEAEKTQLVVWGQGLGPDSKGLEDAINEFERRNPDIEVRMLTMGAGSMNPQKLMTAIVGKVPPDVIHQDRFTIADWANRNTFYPLDDLIERDRDIDPTTPTRDQYYDAVWQEAMYEGKVYGIPTGADNRGLYWNKEIFAENADKLTAAGLDPTRPPRTWTELLAYGEALTEFDEDGRLVRAGFIPNFGNSWLYMYAFQNNASFMSEDGTTCTLNTPEAQEALQFMVDGYEIVGGYEAAQVFQSTFGGGEDDPFILGDVAMKIDGDWNIYGLARFAPDLDYGVAPAPVPDDRFYQRGRFADEPDQFVTWVGGFSYAIPRGAKNKEAAWKFIKFFTSLEGRMISNRGQQLLERRRGRQFVPRIDGLRAANEAAIEELLPANKNAAEAYRAHVALQEFSRIRPATFAGQILWNEHVRSVDLACRGTLSPEDALAAGQVRVQRELDRYFARTQFAEVDLRVPAVIGVFGAVIGIVLLYAGYKKHKLGRLARNEAKWGYLFIAPWVIGFLVFTIGPMLASAFFAFTQYNVLTEARWVGFKNFVDLFTYDGEMITKMTYNILYLGGIGVPLGIVTGLAVALLLNSAVRGMRFYRTIYYMPAIVPAVASTVLWMWLLSPDADRGLINSLWETTIGAWFGTAPPTWLTSEQWAKPSLIFMGLWGAGAGMILWLAGLKGIPDTLYEAAGIDGASPKQQFWSITLPQLSPLVFFNSVMGFIGALQQFDNVYIITRGDGAGPNDTLLVPVYFLFDNAFKFFKMGYASALAWVIFFVILAITGLQFLLAKKWVYYEVQR